MPYYNIDEDDSVFEPLKIKVGGVELVVEDIAKKEFDKISEIKDPYEQLAKLANVTVGKVEHIRMKRISAVLKIISKEFLGPAAGSFTPKKA